MKGKTQEWLDAIKHLRLHFSLLLMPVYLFALSQAEGTNTRDSLLCFIILHLLVYPASNVFNSYHDRDTESVGGIKNPPPINEKMLLLANLFDSLALALALLITPLIGGTVLLYIIASRLYSHRGVRLKKYPYIGFAVIFFFQGAFTYLMVSYGVTDYWNGCFGSHKNIPRHLTFAMLASSFQIGAIYPLTQIYQHKSDLADGVITLSYKLGFKGTFVFSGIMFGIATLFYFLHFKETDIQSFYLLLVVQIPIVLYFVYWAYSVWKDESNANYKHTMHMNTIAAFVLNLYFLYLIIS